MNRIIYVIVLMYMVFNFFIVSTINSISQTATSNNSIPPLDPRGCVYKTEGPTNNLYLPASGHLAAVMVFVDFLDATHNGENVYQVASNIFGKDNKAQKLFNNQSYGNLSLRVRVVPGWKRLSKNSTEYACKSDTAVSFCKKDRSDIKEYIEDVYALYKNENLEKYDMTFIVASRNAALPKSPAFSNCRDCESCSGFVLDHAVLFGKDSYPDINSVKDRNGNLLVHEVGHLLGLPDLYPESGNNSDNKVGAWAMMSNHWQANGFIGWHRHKLGWLDDKRKHYIDFGSQQITLNPLSSSTGISMIVVPIDNPNNPSEVFVIELAQPIMGLNKKLFGEGVLIYKVNAKKESLKNPVEIEAKIAGESPDFGVMFQAPYLVGDEYNDPNGKLKMRVLNKVGDSYDIEITVQ